MIVSPLFLSQLLDAVFSISRISRRDGISFKCGSKFPSCEGSKDHREAQFMRLRERIESRLAALSPWTWPVENGGLFYESSARRSRPAFLDVSQ
jgi:hypothetical protein